MVLSRQEKRGGAKEQMLYLTNFKVGPFFAEDALPGVSSGGSGGGSS